MPSSSNPAKAGNRIGLKKILRITGLALAGIASGYKAVSIK